MEPVICKKGIEMKKFISIIIIVLLFALCSCGMSDESQSVSSNDVSQKTSPNTYHNSSVNESRTKKDSINSESSYESNDSTQIYNTVSPSEAGNKHIISFTPICQYPELPTGCEVTSLAMVLNYYNVDCDKCEISDMYLTKGDVGTVDFNQAFEGDPRDESSYGCYSNVIVETANKIISDKGAVLSVKNFTGSALDELYSFVDMDIPVIVWGTQDCQEGHFSVTWNVNGKDMTWFTPEHCMVLIGYDENFVWVADPIYGDVRSYDKAIFERSYNSLFKQAIVIKSAENNKTETNKTIE